MAFAEPAIAALIQEEGGFRSQDSGRGAVNFGLTAKTAIALKLTSELSADYYIRNLTSDQAHGIYLKHWWEFYRLSQIDSQPLSYVLLTMIVNRGPDPAVRSLQRALRALGRDVLVDGVLGPITLKAVNTCDPRTLAVPWKKDLASGYRSLAILHPLKHGPNLRGWLARLNRVFAPLENSNVE